MSGLALPTNVRSVSVSLHPAFALRSGAPQFLPLINVATARAARRASLGIAPDRDFDVRIEAPLEEAAAAISAATFIAIDIETPRDQPHSISIVGVAVSPTLAYVWRWRPEVATLLEAALTDPAKVKVGHNFAFDTRAFRINGVDVEWPVVDTIQAAALLWPPFAEAKDRPWLRLAWCIARVADGWPFHKDADTEVGKALYRTMFPGIPDWQIPLAYCGMDCLATWRLWAAERQTITAEGMMPLLEEVVAPAAVVLTRLEERGMPLDPARVAALRREAEALITERSRQVAGVADEMHRARLMRIAMHLCDLRRQRDEASDPLRCPPVSICPDHPMYVGLTKRAKCEGCATAYAMEAPRRERVKALTKVIADGMALSARLGTTFNPAPPKSASDDQWRWLLFDNVTGLGLKPTATTKKRRLPMVDDDAIEALYRQRPDVELLRWRVDIQHARRRLSNVLAVRPESDGCVHFAYSMHRTETGRIASGADNAEADKYRGSPGNAQNIPDRDRIIYRPLAADRVFVAADWKQAEARVLAYISADTVLLDAFARGDDTYALIAAALYGIAPEVTRSTYFMLDGQPTSARQIGKKWRLARNYGMGPLKWARMTGMSIKEAMRLDKADRAAYPVLYGWQDSIVERVEREGRLINPFGRVLRFHRFEVRGGVRRLADREEALAFLPQSIVGDMCKAVLPRMDAVGRVGGTAILRTTTHDSFLHEVHIEEAAAVIDEVRPILEAPWRQLGSLDGYGEFSCPADFAVGRNWGTAHQHTARCMAGPAPCPKRENPDGLVEWVPPSPSTAAASV